MSSEIIQAGRRHNKGNHNCTVSQSYAPFP